jgi:hypothetical protein
MDEGIGRNSDALLPPSASLLNSATVASHV